MNRYAVVFLAFVCLVAAPLRAAGGRHEIGAARVDGLSTSRTDLVKTTVAVAGATLEIYARRGVDVTGLLAGIDRTKSMRSEDLYRQIDVARQQLYGHETLVVVGRPSGPEKSKLVRYFYLWNDESAQDDVWYTTCPTNGSTVAVLFVSLFFGDEDFYVKSSTAASYKLIGTVDENGSYQYLTFSQTSAKRTTLGFGWNAIADSSGHIIVYCYA